MRLVLHHAVKDLRAVWPWLVLWALLVLAALVGDVPAVDLRLLGDSRRARDLFPRQLLSLARVVLGMILAARVVHADSPSDSTAFWLTRPLSSSAVVAGKLLLIVGLFVGIPAVANLVALLLNALEPALAPRALLEIALVEALPVVPLALVASLTRDTTRLVLAGIACAIVFVVSRVATNNVVAYTDATAGVGLWMMATLLVGGFLACLAIQYRARRLPRTLATGSAVLAGLVLVGFTAPFDARPAELTRPWPQASSISATLSFSETEPAAPGARTPPSRFVTGQLELRGAPPGIVLRPRAVRGTLRFPDGAAVRLDEELGWSGPLSVAGRSATDAEVTRAAAHALGLTVLHAESRVGPRTVLAFRRDAPMLQGRERMTARYEAEIDIVAHRVRLAGVLPLTEGSRLGVASRHIMFVSRGDDGSLDRVNVRLTTPALLSRRPRGLEFLLVNRRLGQALPGHLRPSAGRLWPLYFSSQVSPVAFPRTLADGRSLGSEWSEALELAVLLIEPEGSFTTRVSAEDVTVR